MATSFFRYHELRKTVTELEAEIAAFDKTEGKRMEDIQKIKER